MEALLILNLIMPFVMILVGISFKKASCFGYEHSQRL